LFSILATLSGGSKKTMEFAREYKKPRLHLHPGIADAADRLRTFVQESSVKVLNVAGPRASSEPGVGEFVMRTLEEAFGQIARPDQHG
jgi:Circularly permutated YpsA SLOG family